MRVIVASDFEPGSSRAHAINVIKTAGGFRRLGHEVTVLCRSPRPGVDPNSHGTPYGEHDLFWITAPYVPDRDRFRDPEGVARAFGDWVAEQAEAIRPDMVYARHFEVALACAAIGLPTALETHAYVGDSKPILDRCFTATADRDRPIHALVTISHRLAQHYIQRGADPARVRVVPDGVDLELFSRPDDIGQSPYPADRPIVTYAGHLYDHKGIPTIIDAAARMSEAGFHLVGGLPDDIARTEKRVAGLANVHVHGPRPHNEIPAWLWHADVLLLPPSAGEPSAAWTSPVKLGEYLASQTPIVASKIPGLLDWVDEPAVTWFAPDDPADLARAVRTALSDSDNGDRLARARELAGRFSYPNRARAILGAVFGRAVAPAS
jgi:glycosyltransferase involved in cell wall biosynthesis